MQFFWDIKNNSVGGCSVVPQTLTATINGAAIDMGLADGPVSALQHTGAISGAGATLATKIQEAIEDPASPGNPLASDWSDIAGATFANVIAANAREFIQFNRSKRFLRAVPTVSGTTPNIAAAVDIFGHRRTPGGGAGFSNSPQT
jgi:hypothetical protein